MGRGGSKSGRVGDTGERANALPLCNRADKPYPAMSLKLKKMSFFHTSRKSSGLASSEVAGRSRSKVARKKGGKLVRIRLKKVMISSW